MSDNIFWKKKNLRGKLRRCRALSEFTQDSSDKARRGENKAEQCCPAHRGMASAYHSIVRKRRVVTTTYVRSLTYIYM